MYKYIHKNVQFKDKIDNKIVKIILMTNPVVLNPNSQKTNMANYFWCTKIRCIISTIWLRKIHEVDGQLETQLMSLN